MTRYWLTILEGPQKGNDIDLVEEKIVVGRHPDCDININDPEISRNHFTLTKKNDEYWIEDLGSTNGTVVNGRPAPKLYYLRDNCRINLGANVTLVFHKEMPKLEQVATQLSRVERLVTEKPPPVIKRKKKEPVVEEKKERETNWWTWGCFGFVLILVIAAVVTLYYIDANFLWCDIFGAWLPGCY
jgi:pSer/pThr/pTyr-binding forkhead associated (FHA) protein